VAVYREATRAQKAQAEAKRAAQIRKLEREFAAMFAKQGRMFLAKLPTFARFFLTEATYDGDLVDAFSEVFGTTRRKAEKVLVDSLFDGINLGYATQAAEFGIEQSFKIGSKRAMAWARENAAARITKIDETTAESIRGVITRGIEGGESYGAVAREIRDSFDGFTTQRANLVAVQENAVAFESGTRTLVDDIQAAGIRMEKMLGGPDDERTSDLCRDDMAAGWIPADEPFPSGEMSAPIHVGCRHDTRYRVAEG
jgi:hypothetical protein